MQNLAPRDLDVIRVIQIILPEPHRAPRMHTERPLPRRLVLDSMSVFYGKLRLPAPWLAPRPVAPGFSCVHLLCWSKRQAPFATGAGCISDRVSTTTNRQSPDRAGER